MKRHPLTTSTRPQQERPQLSSPKAVHFFFLRASLVHCSSSTHSFSSRPWTTHTATAMMKRCSRISSPLAAVALLLLVLVCFFHCAAASRLLPAVPPLLHQENIGVKAGTTADGLVLQDAVNGNELSVSEMMGAEDEEPACEEGNVDECLQRRLLHDAHLDYIYTQQKGKP